MAAIHAHEAWSLHPLANFRAKTIVPPCSAISVPYVKNFPMSDNIPFFHEKRNNNHYFSLKNSKKNKKILILV
ncbi:hypothetical protein, partial [Desulfovibrio piger]|uniref:hypothetical protein n=1 Tax=Desulfovibrio piger TaxID=901 RepID=UPI0037358A5C